MFIGIDGTGPGDLHTYATEMREGFISRLVAAMRYDHLHCRYFRGPTLLGTEVRAIAATVVEDVRLYGRRDRRIVLAGYSRGGAVAILVAQLLKSAGWAHDRTIACMALFDAVDRDVYTDTAVIPGNVQYAYHAMRDRHAGSRLYFGNCGTRIEPPGRLQTRTFFATHAGMGGVPWTGDHPVERPLGAPDALGRRRELAKAPALPLITEEQDRAGSAQVLQWIAGSIRRHGVGVH
jgi:acetyl esterase/lipase